MDRPVFLFEGKNDVKRVQKIIDINGRAKSYPIRMDWFGGDQYKAKMRGPLSSNSRGEDSAGLRLEKTYFILDSDKLDEFKKFRKELEKKGFTPDQIKELNDHIYFLEAGDFEALLLSTGDKNGNYLAVSEYLHTYPRIQNLFKFSSQDPLDRIEELVNNEITKHSEDNTNGD